MIRASVECDWKGLEVSVSDEISAKRPARVEFVR